MVVSSVQMDDAQDCTEMIKYDYLLHGKLSSNAW